MIFLKNYIDLVYKYALSPSQMIQDDHELYIIGAEVIYLLSNQFSLVV